MKLMRIEAMKFHAGTWEQVGPVLKKIEKLGKAVGFPKVRMFASVSGGDTMHTVYMISEWPSLADMEKIEDKMSGNKKMMEAMEELAEVVDTSEVTLLKALTAKDIG